MIEGWMVLGAVVGPVEVSGGPVESELTLGVTAPEPVKRISINLVCLGTMVLFVTPTAVELSVWIRDFVWGRPILMRVWRRGAIHLVEMKRGDSSASAAEDMTNLIISAMVRTGPLKAGVEVSLERKM